MLILLLSISIMLSIIFMFLTHPMSMGMVLLMQTASTTLILGFFSQNFWFSYILFMIMIGGMMVLFIYMTSVASNEKFMFSKKILLTTMLIMLITLPFFWSDLSMFNISTFSVNKMQMLNLILFEESFNKYYFSPSNFMLISLIIYLFITLIAVVKITNINYGPLRQKF